MTSNRRSRSDSTKAALDATKRASTPLAAVPGHLTLPDAARPFWDAILQSRATDEWSEADLLVAVDLARTQSDIQRLQVDLDAQGNVVNGRINPLFRVVNALIARSLRLTRLLQLHPAGRGIRQSDVVQQRRLERQAREVHADLLRERDDDLLA